MESRIYTPAAPLSAFVGCFWYWEGGPQGHSKDRLLPNGECSVVFNLREEPIRIYDVDDLSRYATYGSAVVSGARTNCFAIDTDEQERVLGIQFRAGGAFPFFPMPASAVSNQSVALDDLWPRHSGGIRERLLATDSVASIFAVLEECLLEQLARPLSLHPAVAYSLKHFSNPVGPIRIADVTDCIGLSPRRFIEVFQRQVGLTPKAFCRVRRFQRVLQLVRQKKQTDWAQTAVACGYYDQSHLIHEFELFCGMRPNAYLAAATPHLNHVPL